MNKNALIASAALVAGVAIVVVTKLNSYHKDLYARFPDLDRKVVRKAYRQFMKNATNDVYGDMSNFSEELMDSHFLAIVQEHPLKK